jgi:heme/copper-type cytochrome/quinol oxidase subunit 2
MNVKSETAKDGNGGGDLVRLPNAVITRSQVCLYEIGLVSDEENPNPSLDWMSVMFVLMIIMLVLVLACMVPILCCLRRRRNNNNNNNNFGDDDDDNNNI